MLFCGTPLSLKKKKTNKTLVPNQGSRCSYVCIYLDIYSVFCQAVCLPGCIPGILKTYMGKATKIKGPCLMNSLRHFRPVPKMIYGPRSDDLCDKTRAGALALSAVCFEDSSGWAPKSPSPSGFFPCAERGRASETPPGQGRRLPGISGL